MTRYIRVIFLTCLSIIILTLAVANRELVDIRILPSELEGFLGGGMIFSIPIFVLFLCGVIFGLFVGFVWEWIREMKHRSASSRKSKELAKVENELSQLKRESGQNEDEILLLLNNKTNP